MQYWLLPVLLLLLLVWQALFMAGWLRPLILPSPAAIARSFWQLLANGELFRHIGVSLFRVLEGFTLAAFMGIGLGISIGLSNTVERMSDFLVQLLRPIPPIAWIPLAILWFGIDEGSKIFIIFLGAFFPVLINVIDGVKNTDPGLSEVARIMEISRWDMIRRVVIPGALPSIMTGLRVGLGAAWMCVVAAEMIAASQGVGYLIMDARQLSRTEEVFVGMIAIGLTGKLMDSLIKTIESRLFRWKQG